MKYDSEKHNRRSIRLKGYDYSNTGAYFITVCAYNRECLFGDIEDGKMQLNNCGRIIKSEWLRSLEIRKEIKLDIYQIMPNHFHSIVFIMGGSTNKQEKLDVYVGANGHSSLRNRLAMKSKSLSSLMVGFKSSVKLKINKFRNTLGVPIWQRNYYDHIIRNEKELNKIREYIINNQLEWELDEENPKNWGANP